ncbi:hypothetical protein F7725_021432 [Dissostichus mawsoni]|uniref:PiggyBac transposable element-derived protein domain-containing protein n=1 Tax=Dissostichus mawsoni TaxID=36200 RepID=A0A7J5ZBS8_DISMA|nr:hypothetical protein F7725_021432 [Dissostichus mawsoni]
MDNSYLGRGYHLFVDNFYTSPKLFTDLFARGFVACGTFRDNRKNVPKSKLNALTSKSPRGSIRWLREKELLFVKWMDTREVSVCSTIHQAFNGDTVTRNFMEELSAELCGVPIGSFVPPRGAQCLPESMSCADEEEEEEEGIDSFVRRRSGDTATKGRRKCVLCKNVPSGSVRSVM